MKVTERRKNTLPSPTNKTEHCSFLFLRLEKPNDIDIGMNFTLIFIKSLLYVGIEDLKVSDWKASSMAISHIIGKASQRRNI